MGLTSRLAEKWDEYISTVEPQPTTELPEIEARWWLEAIAAELETEGSKRDRAFECNTGYNFGFVQSWLRTQASEEKDDG